ncbi:hypothetical protein GGI21_001766, partial [Coemansia aciculifera]
MAVNSVDILCLLAFAAHASRAYMLLPGHRNIALSALYALRHNFIYVGAAANSKLARFSDSASSSEDCASPIQFTRGQKAFVLWGVVAKHWVEFSLILLGEVSLGCLNVWKTVAISRLFSLAGQRVSHQELLTLILAAFVKIAAIRALDLQYQLAKMRLQGRVEGALCLALCRSLVLEPGSTHTSSSLADVKRNLVVP